MGRVGLWSAELGGAWLAQVTVTGSAERAAAGLGVPAFVFRNRMRRDGGLRQRYREAQAAAGRQPVAQRATARWSVALGEAFLALLAETGNARQSAIALGAPNAFANRMRRDPEFRRRALEAAAEADARLSRFESAFPPEVEYKSLEPPEDGDEAGGGSGAGRPGRRRPPAPPALATVPPLATDAEALGGYLRPGRKRQVESEPVLRRNSQGRMQATMTREGHWTSRIEADFLALLRATGNFDASARAVGFQPASVHERERTWPAFERDCAAAMAEADAVLTYKLTAHAHALLREPGEAAAAGIDEPEVPFDPVTAMKILAAIDARKYGRSGKGRRKGPPERTFEQACRSILAKIEAIERHERRRGEGGASGGQGEGGGGSAA